MGNAISVIDNDVQQIISGAVYPFVIDYNKNTLLVQVLFYKKTQATCGRIVNNMKA